jgi:hypothetical protein
MTELNGGSYYANVLSSTTFSLYTGTDITDPTNQLNGLGFTDYAFSSVASTDTSNKRVTVGNSQVFSLNDPVRFTGNMDSATSLIDTTSTYYVNALPTGTTIVLSDTVYANGVAGPEKPIGTTTGLTANVYGVGGRAVASIGGGGTSAAQGSNTSVQYNNSGVIDGDGDFVWDFSSNKTLTITGNANISTNINTTNLNASRIFSNVATGTTPIVVNSTTRVANLNVNYANVADNSVVGNLTTGNYFPALVSTSATGNKPLNVSGSYTFDTANAKFVAGNVEATYDVSGSTLTGSLTTAAQPNVTSLGTLTSLEVAGDITPDANVTYDLGNNTNRFRDLYLSGSSITLGFQEITSNATHTTFTNRVTADQFIGNVVGILSGDAGNISNVQGANVAGQVNFAATANAVAGANVSGAVALATSATVANSVAGANVSGEVAFAATANAIAGANVSGQSANALVAGTVYTAAQPNITSVGTLSSLTVTANVGAGNFNATGKVFAPVIEGTSVVTGSGGISMPSGGNIAGNGSVNITGIANISAMGEISAIKLTGGTVQTSILTTGANTTAGSITGNWTLTAGSRLESTYADLAEYYKGEEAYEAGTVVCFGGTEEVHVSDVKGSRRVAGIVSTNPAYLMNSTCSGIPVAVALQGRVPCKVTGKCEKGDVMVSDGQGGATAWYHVATIMHPGMTLGKAIEDKTSKELSIIEVAVGRL